MVAPFLEAANRVTSARVVTHGHTLAEMRFAPEETPCRFIADIWNLVWKLGRFLSGAGSDELLESYSSERQPVIRHVIETTDRPTRAMGTPSKVAQVLRDAIIPMVSHLAPFQHAFVQRLAALDISYRGSPIVEGAGRRYFDDSLRGGDGIRSR